MATEALATDLFDAHVASVREEHERRHRALVSSLERLPVPGALSWRVAEGGLYLWCRLLTPGLDSSRLQEEAARAGVSFVAGRPFYADGGGERRIRPCYTSLPPAHIERGIGRPAGLPGEANGETAPRASASRLLV